MQFIIAAPTTAVIVNTPPQPQHTLQRVGGGGSPIGLLLSTTPEKVSSSLQNYFFLEPSPIISAGTESWNFVSWCNEWLKVLCRHYGKCIKKVTDEKNHEPNKTERSCKKC